MRSTLSLLKRRLRLQSGGGCQSENGCAKWAEQMEIGVGGGQLGPNLRHLVSNRGSLVANKEIPQLLNQEGGDPGQATCHSINPRTRP